ncbi:MAG: methyl-accepting chemotaxis protein [Deltaproteobacteria bacterium]|nr:methyl-accepting chemotaxis protein [Deltaproteobacteria bacterium]MBW1849418.1 methyl-accepting chemotaxis protein [Deltaproteobacteria bacterium]MBW2180944.1 methyl-accepting chemotaxis protein [Deltaproteobacteria bacterium]
MAEKTKRKSRRKLKNFLLSNDTQLRIIIPNLIWMLLIIIATMGVVLSPLMIDMFLSDDIEIQYRAATTFLAIIKPLIPTIIAMFVLIFIHQVILTNRIFGPLVNFNHTFKKMAEGDLTRKVEIRAEDYMKWDSQNINHMIEGLSSIVTRTSVSNDKLIESIGKVKKRVDDIKTRDQVLEALELLKREAENVKEGLSRFKL